MATAAALADKVIGFLGAGMIGGGIVQSLLRAGGRVRICAHRASVADLVALGAEECDSPEAVVAGADIIITCLPDALVVAAMAERLAPHLGVGTLWIDTTTSDPDVTRKLHQDLKRRGVLYIDSPVTGSPAHAARGELGSFVGCAEGDFPRIEAVVSLWSATVRRFGEVGAGHSAKLLNNGVTQGTTVLLAATFGLARQAGVDWSALYDVMMVGAARSGTLEKAVGPALKGDYDGARFAIGNAEKDLRYLMAFMENLGEESPILRAAAQQLAALKAAGWGEAFVSQQLNLPIMPQRIPRKPD